VREEQNDPPPQAPYGIVELGQFMRPSRRDLALVPFERGDQDSIPRSEVIEDVAGADAGPFGDVLELDIRQ
jgi:hypothetical protein